MQIQHFPLQNRILSLYHHIPLEGTVMVVVYFCMFLSFLYLSSIPSPSPPLEILTLSVTFKCLFYRPPISKFKCATFDNLFTYLQSIDAGHLSNNFVLLRDFNINSDDRLHLIILCF